MKFTILFILTMIYCTTGLSFEDCSDVSTEPAGSPKLYEIIKNEQGATKLLAVETPGLIDPSAIFEAVNENARFTTYRCWDDQGYTTGFDPQLITEIVAASGDYNYIRFNSIAWHQPEGEPISFFTHLDQSILNAGNGEIDFNGNIAGGSVAQAGMSITDERLEWGHMVGPIYRAGKIILGRVDKLTDEKKAELMGVPSSEVNPYEAFRGLTLVTEGNGSIRGKYFIEIAKAYPDLINFLVMTEESGEKHLVESQPDPGKFNVILTNNDMINLLVEAKMSRDKAISLFGIDVDLTLVDTGSIRSLKDEGKIEKGLVEVVSRNLSVVDKEFSHVFGSGDGIVISKVNSEMQDFITKNLIKIICNGRLEELIFRWFDDENSADLSWAECR